MTASVNHVLAQVQRWITGMTALILSVILAASAAVALVNRGQSVCEIEDMPPSVASLPRQRDGDTPRARTDAFGDPLPQGAIARLGTVRFRHGGDITFLSFTPDGKRLVSKGIDGVRVWEITSGREVWHLPLAANTERGTVDLSPDGKRLAVADPGAANTIQLWNVDSGNCPAMVGACFLPVETRRCASGILPVEQNDGG